MGRYDHDNKDFSPPRRRGGTSLRRYEGQHGDDRSPPPPEHRRRHIKRTRSRSPQNTKGNTDRRPDHYQQRYRHRSNLQEDDSLPSSQQRWGKHDDVDDDTQPEKEPEPQFGLSGLLAAETNTVKYVTFFSITFFLSLQVFTCAIQPCSGIVLLHNEPPEARPPTTKWRVYIFKDGQPYGDPLHLHKQSSYLFGKERKVADIPTDHPSCSKQHAVIQFRVTEKEGADGMMHGAVRPYLMDLGSTNGTMLNGERIESERYYELLEKDVLKFGNSSREYVLLKEV